MTATATPAATVEHALAAAPGMMTVPQLRTKTGLDEKTVRAELRRLAGLGQIEHIPGRGRYDGRYGLTTTSATQREKPQPEVGKNTGSRASVPSSHSAEGAAVRPEPAPQPAAQPVAAVAEDEPGRRVTHNPHTGAPRDPRDIESDPMGLLIIDPRKLVNAASETAAPRTPSATEFSLLGVLADNRAAIGDPTGKIMLGELADAVRARVDGAQMAGDTVLDLQAMLGERQRTVENLTAMIATASELLAPWVPGGIDTSDMDLEELATQVVVATADMTLDQERTADALRNARALADKLQHLLDSKTHECEALRHAAECAGDVQPITGYLVRPSGLPPVISLKAAAAQAAALSYARRGKRADVYGLVRIGGARVGAEWRPA